jgi:adenosylmethionine-8-amino-7-oxononanoate aminotransferase
MDSSTEEQAMPEPARREEPREAANVRNYVSRVMVDFTQMKSFTADPLILTEGDGVRVKDIDGRWYFDGLSGTFCMSLGHGNRRVIDAAAEQMGRLAMAAPTMGTSDRSLEMAGALLALLPAQYTHLKWGSGGSEAVEAAIKMARQFHRQAGEPRKYKVLSHYRGYHGVTGNALAASGWRASRSPYEPFSPGFIHLHTPDSFRPPFDVPPSELGATYARLVEQVIELEGPETIAALITEPILMSAGVTIPPRDYLPALRRLCDKHDIVLIFDEIITGFGRTGHLFASQLFSTWPDILVLGKGITGGYAPLSATVITERLAAAFWGDEGVEFSAGHTFAGNPVACAVGLAALQETLERDLVGNAAARGEEGLARLSSLQDGFPFLGDVRGQGLLFGLEFVADRLTKEPFPASENVGIKVRQAARRKGLLLRASHWMAVLAPPLTTTAEELAEMLDIFEDALTEVLSPLDRPSPVVASS